MGGCVDDAAFLGDGWLSCAFAASSVRSSSLVGPGSCAELAALSNVSGDVLAARCCETCNATVAGHEASSSSCLFGDAPIASGEPYPSGDDCNGCVCRGGYPACLVTERCECKRVGYLCPHGVDEKSESLAGPLRSLGLTSAISTLLVVAFFVRKLRRRRGGAARKPDATPPAVVARAAYELAPSGADDA